MDKQKLFFRVTYVPRTERWLIETADEGAYETTERLMSDIERVLSLRGDQLQLDIGPFVIRGVDAAQLARVQDYLAMLKESWDASCTKPDPNSN